jgi:hypothetical protein
MRLGVFWILERREWFWDREGTGLVGLPGVETQSSERLSSHGVLPIFYDGSALSEPGAFRNHRAAVNCPTSGKQYKQNIRWIHNNINQLPPQKSEEGAYSNEY